MIAFVSLFLGLTLSVQTVEVAVAESVGAVELRLDGVTLSRIEGAPWVTQVDFGDRLVPQLLEAVAFDREGAEIGRVSQAINLPRPPAEAALVIEALDEGLAAEHEGGGAGSGEADARRFARLTWESTAASEPRSVSVTFDGRPLSVPDPRRFELPPHDPNQLHFLRAELDFSDSVSAIAEATFGGVFADQVVTEMTAVPLELGRARTELTLDALHGRFTAAEQTLPVLAVEEGPAEVVFVIDQSAEQRLGALARSWSQQSYSRSTLGVRSDPRFVLQLDERDQMRFLWPFTEASLRRDFAIELFPPSPPLRQGDGGVLWYLAFANHPSYAPERQRLADAVAVAGSVAATRGRRRIVVLVLGPRPVDHSRLTALQARELLSSLGVPLMVWTTHRKAPLEAWLEADGEESPVSIQGFTRLSRAVGELKRRLARQRIVWVAGSWLPQAIRFEPESSAVERIQ